MEYYASVKKTEIIKFPCKSRELEYIILSDATQI